MSRSANAHTRRQGPLTLRPTDKYVTRHIPAPWEPIRPHFSIVHLYARVPNITTPRSTLVQVSALA